jgi:hypothetical protein
LEDFYISISRTYLYEGNGGSKVEMFVAGLETGEIMIKDNFNLKDSEKITIIKPETQKKTGKVSFITSYKNKELLAYGS